MKRIGFVEGYTFPDVELDGFMISKEGIDHFHPANASAVIELYNAVKRLYFSDEDIVLYIFKGDLYDHMWVLNSVFVFLNNYNNKKTHVVVYDKTWETYASIIIESINDPMIIPIPDKLPPASPENIKKQVCAIIYDEQGRILMEDHIKKDGYVFPGGKVDIGEDPEVALMRELYEELGIRDLQIDRGVTFTACGEYPVGSGNIINWEHIVYMVTGYEGEPVNKEPDKCNGLYWYYEQDLVQLERLKERFYFDGPGKAYRNKILATNKNKQ